MSTALVKLEPQALENRQYTLPEIQTLGKLFVESGLFPDIRGAAQACVKILAGQEMGFGPFASMNGISIVQGRSVVGGNLIAAKIKASGKYDYVVHRMDDTGCELEFFQHGKSMGPAVVFTIEDAKNAGLLGKDVWKKYPRNMLFNRAVSNGCKWYTPDVFVSGPVYTPEEMDLPVDSDGNPVQPTKPVAQINPAPPAATPPAKMSKADAERLKADSLLMHETLKDCGFQPKEFPAEYDTFRGSARVELADSLREQLNRACDELAARLCDEGKLSDGELEDSAKWTGGNTVDVCEQIRKLHKRVDVPF